MRREQLYASGVAVPLLMIVAALSVALSLYEASWAPGLGMLPLLVVLAIAFALVAVRTALPSWVLHVTSTVLGFVATAYFTAAHLLPELSLGDGAQFVVYRMSRWVEAVAAGQPTQDPLPFTFLLGMCLWLAFHYSTWLVYRSGRVWWAVVGPAIALFFNSYYSASGGAAYVAIYAFCALLLVVRVSLQGLAQDWRLARIPHDRTLGEDFLIDAAYLVAAALVVAWLVPPLPLEKQAEQMWVRFERPWRSVQKQWGEWFPSTMAPGRATQSTIYGDSLPLGGPVELPEWPVLHVRMEGGPSRLQGMVYDLYDGRQWWSSASAIALMEPNQYPTVEAFQDRGFIEQQITVLTQTRSLVAAPSPRWFGLPVKSEHVAFPIEQGLAGLDIYASTSRAAMAPGDTYQALSAVSTASREALRQAGERYPTWLPDVYFGVPASLPERVKALALEITADAEDPYDKAEAIEAYLRTLTYNQDIDAPPPGADAVDHFLFVSQEGYCNYFASAMALMARSVGLPTRIAAGYAPGQYDAALGAYVVPASAAHSWPQVYFPGYGWVDFEPTPSQSVVRRPEPPPPPAEQEEEPDRSFPQGDLDRYEDMMEGFDELYGGMSGSAGAGSGDGGALVKALVAGAVAFLLAAPVLLLWVLPRRAWSTAERVYVNMMLVARLFGVRPTAFETPAEYGGRVATALPEAAPDVSAIVAGYNRARYRATRAVDPEGEGTLLEAWARLRAVARGTLSRRLASLVDR